VELLHRELRRQSGIDLYILLLDRQPPTAPEDAQDSHDLHPAPAQTKAQPAYLNGPELLEQPAFGETFFPVDPVKRFDPYSLPADDPFAQRWLIVESSAPANRFRRLPAGPYLCAVQGRSVCEITIEFRKHEIRGIRARFIELNGAQHPDSWIAPDPLLLGVLKKQA
jgi:hypothetical protein